MDNNIIVEILDVLRSNDFYGAGNYTEIAKGKHEYVTTWKGFKRKVKRILKSR